MRSTSARGPLLPTSSAAGDHRANERRPIGADPVAGPVGRAGGPPPRASSRARARRSAGSSDSAFTPPTSSRPVSPPPRLCKICARRDPGPRSLGASLEAPQGPRGHTAGTAVPCAAVWRRERQRGAATPSHDLPAPSGSLASRAVMARSEASRGAAQQLAEGTAGSRAVELLELRRRPGAGRRARNLRRRLQRPRFWLPAPSAREPNSRRGSAGRTPSRSQPHARTHRLQQPRITGRAGGSGPIASP